ncbi:MAG: AI-2E family transporter [Candidatus Pacearchaeota archaeon]|nr:AI-2E family transporter [Candidatus Pacearchaeota archaeon]
MENSKKIATIIIVIALATIAFFLVRLYISVILASAVLAFLLQWPYKKLKKIIKKEDLAALTIVIFIVGFLAFFVYIVAQATVREAFNLYLSIQRLDTYHIIEKFVRKIFGSAQFSAQLTTAIQGSIVTITNKFVSAVGDFVTNIPKLIFQLFVLIFLTFYFLKEGNKIVETLKRILPFGKEKNEKFITRSKEIASATIIGMVLVGVIQGITASVGFYLFGAPSPLFFSLLATFFAILPFVGPWLVWAPVGLAMIAAGNVLNGIFLMTFGLLVVGTVDNIIRPIIVGRKAKINPAIALIGMLGGLSLLGPIGIIVGPIILEYLLMFIFFYKE